jgi:hypothetical protein
VRWRVSSSVAIMSCLALHGRRDRRPRVPPLSQDLRDSRPGHESRSGRLLLRWTAGHAGGRFPERRSLHAVLSPESFRGGCSFGVPPTPGPAGSLPRCVLTHTTDRDVIPAGGTFGRIAPEGQCAAGNMRRQRGRTKPPVGVGSTLGPDGSAGAGGGSSAMGGGSSTRGAGGGLTAATAVPASRSHSPTSNPT